MVIGREFCRITRPRIYRNSLAGVCESEFDVAVYQVPLVGLAFQLDQGPFRSGREDPGEREGLMQPFRGAFAPLDWTNGSTKDHRVNEFKHLDKKIFGGSGNWRGPFQGKNKPRKSYGPTLGIFVPSPGDEKRFALARLSV